MTHDEIRAAIVADPAIYALLPSSEAIAGALSAGRKRLQPRQVSERGILAALGPAAGGKFLSAIEGFAAMTLPADHPLFAAHGGIARAIRWLKDAEGIDVGDANTQTMLATFAAIGVTDPGATATVQALGFVGDPVSEFDVRCAIFNADGTLAL